MTEEKKYTIEEIEKWLKTFDQSTRDNDVFYHVSDSYVTDKDIQKANTPKDDNQIKLL